MASPRGDRSMWWDRRNPNSINAEPEFDRAQRGDTAARQSRASVPLSSLPPAASVMPHSTPTADPRSSGGSFIVDGNGLLLAFDRGMERLTGWNAYEIVGQPKDLGTYQSPDETGVRAFRALPLYDGRLPRTAQTVTTTLTLNRKDGAKLEVEALVSPLGPSGNRYAVEIKQVVARVPGAIALPQQEGVDPLTGFPTIERFHELLRGAFQAARDAGRPLSVLLIEVDKHFDIVNSGTQELNPEVTRRAAGVVQASVRGDDPMARINDSRFALVLDGTGRGDARAVGGRIRNMVENISFGKTLDGTERRATVSVGVACYPADGDSAGELMRRADEALREAMRLGRNRVWCYVRRPRVPVAVEVYFDGPEGQMLGTSRDMSNSGMFVETGDELPEGMRLGLKFSLPEEPGLIRVVGRVARRVRAGGLENALISGLGIEFERYSDQDRRALEGFLHQKAGAAV